MPKSSSELRPCDHYRALNKITVTDRYLVAHLHDFSTNLHGMKILSKTDVVKAYLQIPVQEAEAKTGLITPIELFEFTRMKFGFYNAARTVYG